MQTARKRKAVLDVAQKVKSACYNLLLAKKLAIVARDAVASLESHQRRTAKFYEKGMIPYNDLLKARVALADVRQKRETALAGVEKAGSWLNLLLARNMDDPVEVEDIASTPEPDLGFSEYLEEALEQRPEVKILSLGMEYWKNSEKIAGSVRYPRIALVGRYERNGEDILARENTYSNSSNAMVSLQADWQLFDSGRTRANVSRCVWQGAALSEKLKACRDMVLLEVKNAWTDLQVAEKNIHTAEKALAQAGENKRITDLQYRQQMATSTDVLDAQSFLSGAENSYYQALYGYMISLAALERAGGRVCSDYFK